MMNRRLFMSAAILTLRTGLARADPKIHHVEITNFEFSPKWQEVHSGDTVIFVNKDIVPHTVTALDGSLNSGDLLTGDRWSMEVTSTGAFDYFCEHHPVMRGTLMST